MTSERIASSTRAASGVANDVRVALAQSGVLRRIQPGIHARQDREAPGRWDAELALGAETGGVLLVGANDFLENGHGALLVVGRPPLA